MAALSTDFALTETGATNEFRANALTSTSDNLEILTRDRPLDVRLSDR